MRVYSPERLKNESKSQLAKMLEMVKTNIDLTNEEIEANVEILNRFLNNGTRSPMQDIIEDIEAGRADISDMSGH